MNTSILGGIIFVAVFAGIILVHELGHFVAAKLFHMEVEEFGFGFPPRIAKLFTWKGTDFTLNWIPLGGFNKLKAESDPDVPNGFAAASPWKRIPVLAAGAFMNLLMGVLFTTILFSQTGIPQTKVVEIGAVSPGSPAEQAGILVGDRVISAQGQMIQSSQQLIDITYTSLGKPMQVEIRRGEDTIALTVTPRTIPPEGQGPMGVGLSTPVKPVGSWFETIPISFRAVWENIQSLLSLPGRIIAGTLSPEERQIGGPRSIWNLIQQAVSRDVTSRDPTTTPTTPGEMPTNYTLLVIISLTITVGIANLLPIPALDGWHIFTALVEVVIRRKIPTKYQAAINGIGFIVLITLLGFFYIKDFFNPVNIVLP
jgi:regulator of sigma E protease